MGVDLGGIIPKENRKLADFQGKIIAIDAYNALYQFISIIRQPDGTPLKDAYGRITSHLSGLFYRTINLLEAGVKPVYVFDGIPHKLKLQTIAGRADIRDKAALEWKDALDRGDIETARTKAMQSSKLTKEMVEEAKKLLEFLGVPYINAPSEGEAQASYMALNRDVYCAASQDFDSLLFGTPVLVRNLAITGKRKLPKKNIYVDVEIEEISAENVLHNLGIARERLIDMGILVGTDYNTGIKGIGPKKALKLIKEHGNLENVLRAIGEKIEHYDEIKNIFMSPEVTNNYKLQWYEIDNDKVKEFLCEEYSFSETRVENALKKLQVPKEEKTQKSLEEWI